MAFIWKIYKLVDRLVPKSFIKKMRYWVEAHFDFLWEKKSYSQFGEDLILTELLHRRSLKNGFYVDIGAFAPKQFSNTYLLYKQGWRGINIDATPGSMKAFTKARPQDISLEVAVSDKEGSLTFYTWGTPTVTNTLSKEHAEHHAKIIGRPPVEVIVPGEKLVTVLNKHRHLFSQIDVMNIDVENHTMEVLRSNDWSKYRPSILIVEIEGELIDKITSSDEHSFLLSVGYKMRAWTNPSVFYELS